MAADLESKTAVADEAMKKLEAKDAEIQEKSAQIEASQAEIEQLKQKFIETEAAAGAESDKDAKIAELETAVNAKNEELEAKNQEQSSLQAASQGFKNILGSFSFRLHKTQRTPSAVVFEVINERFFETDRQINNLVNGRDEFFNFDSKPEIFEKFGKNCSIFKFGAKN